MGTRGHVKSGQIRRVGNGTALISDPNIARYPVAAALNTSTEYLPWASGLVGLGASRHQHHPGILRLANHTSQGGYSSQSLLELV